MFCLNTTSTRFWLETKGRKCSWGIGKRAEAGQAPAGEQAPILTQHHPLLQSIELPGLRSLLSLFHYFVWGVLKDILYSVARSHFFISYLNILVSSVCSTGLLPAFSFILTKSLPGWADRPWVSVLPLSTFLAWLRWQASSHLFRQVLKGPWHLSSKALHTNARQWQLIFLHSSSLCFPPLSHKSTASAVFVQCYR